VADHIQVLDEAIAQIPWRYRRDLLVTVDGAGASHGLVDHITALNASPRRRVHYSIGWDLGPRERVAIGRVPSTAWGPVLDHEGSPRPLAEAAVVELTTLLREHPGNDQLQNWPRDIRIICRREKPHPGAQLSLFEHTDGWRYQLFATNTSGHTVQFLEARHRPHARVEDSIRCAKQTGIGHLPSASIQINRAWCLAATIAADLLCWLRLLCLEGPWPRRSPRPCATGCCTPPPVSSAANANEPSRSRAAGPGPTRSPPVCVPRSPCPHQPDDPSPRPRHERHSPDPWNRTPTRRDSRAARLNTSPNEHQEDQNPNRLRRTRHRRE